MMRVGFIVLCLCFGAVPSFAQQSIESLCNNVAEFAQIDGVEFQPNAGAVPADLNSVQDPILGSISIPVEIDLAEYFNRPSLRNVPGLLLEPEIANIEINLDGAIYYNGQEISADLRRACGTPVPKNVPAEVKDVAAPPPKPENKPKKPIKAVEKKSGVRVFNGPEVVISDRPVENIKTEIKKVPEKPDVVDENAIDDRDLKAQDNKDSAINSDGDEDSVLEGQYP